MSTAPQSGHSVPARAETYGEHVARWREANGSILYSDWCVEGTLLDDNCPLNPCGKRIFAGGAQVREWGLSAFSATVRGHTWGDVWEAVDAVYAQMSQHGVHLDHVHIDRIEVQCDHLTFHAGC